MRKQTNLGSLEMEFTGWDRDSYEEDSDEENSKEEDERSGEKKNNQGITDRFLYETLGLHQTGYCDGKKERSYHNPNNYSICSYY